MAAVTGTHRMFPEGLRASGQSLYSGLTYGAGNAAGFFGAGAIFKWGGAQPMWILSAVTALLAAVLSLRLWRERQLRIPAPVPSGAAGAVE